MKSGRAIGAVLALVFSLCVISSAEAVPPSVTVTEIGSFGHSSTALGVNAVGQVIGADSDSTGQHAFSWTQSGGVVDVGDFGGTQTFPYDLNSNGQVVGLSYLSGDASRHGHRPRSRFAQHYL